jgi:hypothetical protein
MSKILAARNNKKGEEVAEGSVEGEGGKGKPSTSGKGVRLGCQCHH